MLIAVKENGSYRDFPATLFLTKTEAQSLAKLEPGAYSFGAQRVVIRASNGTETDEHGKPVAK